MTSPYYFGGGHEAFAESVILFQGLQQLLRRLLENVSPLAVPSDETLRQRGGEEEEEAQYDGHEDDRK